MSMEMSSLYVNMGGWGLLNIPVYVSLGETVLKRFRRGTYSREDAGDKALYEDALDETGTVNTEAWWRYNTTKE